MSWAPGRGRPVAMPNDYTPLRGSRIDARARVAWLLRVNRLAGSPGPASAFVEKLRAHDCIVGTSTLCRYETGTEPVPMSVVRAYELALKLPAGQLVGVCAGLDRMFGGALAVEATASPLPRVDLLRVLGQWETQIENCSMRGVDWVNLAELLSKPSGPVLPPSVVHNWVSRLVTETMRSVHEAFTTRIHALGLLLTEPGISRIVLESIDEVTGAPGAQAVSNVLAVLGSSQDRFVLQWLVDHFEQSTGEHQWGAAYALLSPICRGTLPGDLVPAISRAVLDAASEGLDRGRPAFMIAQRLSASLMRQAVSRLGCYPAPTGSGARVQSPAGLSAYSSAALQESRLDDPMVERLLREALSPDFVERRHHSSLVLAASPYREVLANVAVDLVSSANEPFVGDSASSCLVYLAGAGQRRKLIELLVTEPRRRGSSLLALARSGGVPDGVDLTTYADDPEQVHDVVYAAGLSGHSNLRLFANSPDSAGGDAQQCAQWWRRVGSAITDRDARLPIGAAQRDDAQGEQAHTNVLHLVG
ncbi:hypothetical protein [Flexivirga oryzae]|uniref:Uncharacterized protein n=1 Tax=Flexivirga oryzae TaxID=1794944 RepID=A0A839MY85_9MICO|nr:hypothetical protein [Flexivirga oryzae]MBB2890137.1 hypothetical protein [Flexivirga oryzae]